MLDVPDVHHVKFPPREEPGGETRLRSRDSSVSVEVTWSAFVHAETQVVPDLVPLVEMDGKTILELLVIREEIGCASCGIPLLEFPFARAR
jgi:hypothetical protein